jgi:hypothetical protein
METVDTPDVYGFTVFCEDIRREIHGGVSLIGVVSGAISVSGQFPVNIPKFSFAVALLQRRPVFNPNVRVWIFLPGDDDQNASIQTALAEPQPGATVAALNATTPIKEKDQAYATLNGHLTFAPLTLKTEGVIKVRAIIGEKIYRLGALFVSQQSPASS